ncbi:MAG TPA: hypothetical protein VMZ53_12195 [Kofleriaceae bacterium]|nr:hypothetical protein [Kofleriaceae bacterium]
MKRFSLLALSFTACIDSSSTDLDLASADPEITSAEKADAPSWENAATLHEGTRIFDRAGANSRRVHSLWISGSNMNHVPLVVDARATDANDVRIAVLGPLVNGVRPVLAADGYAQRKRDASVTLDISKPGEHLVVVGSYNLASETFYDLHATCPGPDGCGVSRYDVLATPKDGALVGDSTRLVSMLLGDVMVGHSYDVNVELWASPPMQPWNATKVGTSTASGTQVNAIIPASVHEGDDLKLVVRQAGGRVLDTGVTTRFFPNPHSFARLDSILYGDIASLQIAGVVGYFEGVADMRLFSETREMELAHTTLHADRPGQEGNGYNSFDATFLPDYATNASLAPHDGEILSVGYINGNGDYRRLGCFEYCNNLSGLSSCTGGARSCP